MRMAALSPAADVLSRSAAREPARPWVAVVGIGEDGRAGLSQSAERALDGAELVVGAARHLALAAPLAAETRVWPSPLSDAFPEILKRRGRPVCVLATGDPFHYGVGAKLARLVPADEIVCFPQASAFSLAAARLGWSLPDCACVSLHGRALERVIPHLQPRTRLIALSWDGTTPARLAALLSERGFGRSIVTVLEAMGGARERIRRSAAAAFDLRGIDPLNTIAVEIATGAEAHIVTLAPGLNDGWFENDGQLTKREIRAVTLSALAPRAGELLWDVGAGAGSIAIEWLLRHPANRAVAVEVRLDRAERIGRNAHTLGTPDLRVVVGEAPAALSDLPQPDAIFIGGGGADAGVFEACWAALRSGGRLVANGITLETEEKLLRLFAAHGGSLIRIEVSRAEPVGSLHSWRPAMPVTQWTVAKP
jgi:precorrin-6B C5,15-methyltransferase / cobalt-precorrin-6B C5,C15-methyltransferase